MTQSLSLWLFSYAFVWGLLWFLVLPLRAGFEKPSRAKGAKKNVTKKNVDGEAGYDSARVLWRKALVVSLLAILLTTLLWVALARLI